VKQPIPDFDRLWEAYPRGRAAEVKQRIGGRVDYAWIENTCAIRMSRSFNYSDAPLPRGRRGLNTVSGADGRRYAYRVREFRDHWLEREYGNPRSSHANDGDGGPVPESFRGRRGVIEFVVPAFDDATGHLDLWNGSECAGHGYWQVATEVHLWEDGAVLIRGSVGARARNAPGDVRVVQGLLASAGHDPGPVDGLSGVRTRAAIRAFQAGFLQRPDGRVDADGPTWRTLVSSQP
jgi:hypothetical protein